MHSSTSHYKISILIAKAIAGRSFKDLAANLKCKNVFKVRRHFENWLQKGKGKMDLLDRLIKEQILTKALLETALASTQEQLNQEANSLKLKAFKPYIFIETEREVLGSWCIAMLANKQKRIKLEPYITEISESTLLDMAKQIIKLHLKKTGGKCGTFGRITGYRFYSQYEKDWAFTPTGHLKSQIN